MERINKKKTNTDVNSIFPFEIREGHVYFNERSSTYNEVLRVVKKVLELVDFNQIIKKL